MFQYYDFENEQHITLLVNQFEEMQRNGSIGFFEVSSFLRLLDFYEDNNHLDKALEVLDCALSQHPYSATLFIRKASLLFESDDIEGAFELLEKAELFDAGEIDIYFLRAEILTWKRLYDEALDTLDTAIQYANTMDKYDILLHRANVYEDSGQFDEMFDALKQALLMNPSGEEALDRMWLTVELSEKYEESIELHNQLLDIDAYSHQAWYNLGHAYFCNRAFEKAAEAYEFAFTINEKFEAAYRDGAEALTELGEYKEAIKVWQSAIENVRPDASFYMHIGNCYEQLEDFQEAKEYYLKAARKEPQNAEVFYRLGECYAKEDRWTLAVGAYRKAIRFDERNAVYIAALGEAYYQLDEFTDAESQFVYATELDRENSEIWVQYITFLIDIEEFESAFDMMEKAQTYCQSTEFLYCKAACLHFSGMHKAALEMLTFALTEDFSMSQSLFELFPDLEEVKAIRRLIEQFRKQQ